VEIVLYKEIDGESKFYLSKPLEVVAEEGSVLTYAINDTIKEAGVYRFALRMYPNNPALPHRQDFAYVRWF
jgi:starch phosphorylase